MVSKFKPSGKIIKKTGLVLAWTLGIILLFVVIAFFTLQSPVAQTWLAKRATAYLSKELKAKVTIRAVDIDFFRTVNLLGIYVEDQHGDTLLYADKLAATINRFDFTGHYISISTLVLADSKIKLKKYQNESGLSFQFIADYFQSTDTLQKTPSAWEVNLAKIKLDNIIFAYIDTRDTINDPGMDYENIRVTKVSAEFYAINAAENLFSFKIKDLQGTERCGLVLNKFSALLSIKDSSATFDDLKFTTRGSEVDGFISFQYNAVEDISNDFIHKVTMDGHFSKSIIEMGEIAYFSPYFLGIKKKVFFTGDIKGKVDQLKIKNVAIEFGNLSHISGNFSISGLPNVDEMQMNFKVREAITDIKDLEDIPVFPFQPGDHITLPSNMALLGKLKFSGYFDGFLDDFVAHGKLNTDLGNVRLDNVSMTRDSIGNTYSYLGEVVATHFNIGKFYDIPDLSYVSGKIQIDGTGLAEDNVHVLINGNFPELVYNNYSYTGISILNGKFRRQIFDGDFHVDDPNLKMDFKGIINNSNSNLPNFVFDAKIKSANLSALGFMDKSHKNIFSTNLHINFHGNNIDNLDGQIIATNMVYQKDEEKFTVNEFSLNAGTNDNGTRTVFLESDIVRATLKGKFKLLELPSSISTMLSNSLPAYFPVPTLKEVKKSAVQDFVWFVNFQKNVRPIQSIIPQLVVAPNTSFSGKFLSEKKGFEANLSSPSLTYNGIAYNGIQLEISKSNSSDASVLVGTMKALQFNDTIGIKNLIVDARACHDSLLTKIIWDNHTVKLNDANIMALTHFENSKAVNINFFSSSFHLNDSLWVATPVNFVRLDSSQITFHNLGFQCGRSSIDFSGKVSEQPDDELKVSLKDFDFAYVNYFSEPFGVTLAGSISSETVLLDLYHVPIFTSSTEFKSFYFNKQKLGDGSLTADWQKNKQAVFTNGHFSRGINDALTGKPINNIAFDGYYYPKNIENSIDFNASLQNIPLDIFTPILKDYCSLINGKFGGDLHILGTPSKPLLNGKINIFPRKIQVDYLGLSLSGPQQPIFIESNSFFFDDFRITDGLSDTAIIYGHLFHDNFSNFQFDMDFSFEHFMVLNTNANQNEDYFGRVFSTGYMNVFGFANDHIRLDINAKTEKIIRGGQPILSEFNIPMSGTSEVGTSDFITFEDKKKLIINKKTNQLKNNGVELHLNVEANPDVIVKVIFDKTVGDEITAYGNGNLNMDISPSGDFTIFGRYEVERGNYLFTMKNIILVPFELARGGTISWNGDPYVAQINADAVYKTSTSVEPFFPADSLNQAYHRSYPVEVVMHLTDNLLNPTVLFDINLPTVDQTISETVKIYTQTDLEKNRQVLSLMVLNSFMTPSDLREGNSAGSNVAAGTSATLLSNFVSGTMNNWLSQISSDFNLGVKYRPNDDLTTQELKVYLGTQLLNNRITIDGNVGKVNANQATSSTGTNGQWVGDVNIEYKVNETGKVRVRAFNRSNDNTVITSNSPYTQGVGLFYREEFETASQLAKRFNEFINLRKKKLVKS